MAQDKTLKALYEHVRQNGGVVEWANALGIKPPTMYAKLSGGRPIKTHEAVLIERKSNGRFSKELLIFGRA